MDLAQLLRLQRHPEPEARGAAAVVHALTEVEGVDRLHEAVGDHRLGDHPGPLVLGALGGGHQDPAARGVEQLGVEEVGPHRLAHHELLVADDEGAQLAADRLEALPDAGEGVRLVKGPLVEGEPVAAANGDDVVVEDPGVDHRRALLREERLPDPMASDQGLAGLQGLAGRVALGGRALPKGHPTVDVQLQPPAVGGDQAGVVGRPLVAEGRVRGQRLVVHEGLAGEDAAKRAGGLPRLQRAVEGAGQVGRGDVDLPVRGIAAGGDGRRVGGPHRRGGVDGGQEMGRDLVGARDDPGIGAGEAQPPQDVQPRPVVGRQHPLGEPQVPDEGHLP